MHLSYRDVTAFVNVCRSRGVEGPRIAEALRTLGFGEDLIALALEEAGLAPRRPGRIPAVEPPPIQPTPAPHPAEDPTRPLAEAPSLNLSDGTRSLMTAALGTIPEIRVDLTNTHSVVRRAKEESERAAAQHAAARRALPPIRIRPNEPKIELAPLPPPRRASTGRRATSRDYFEATERARERRSRRQRRVFEKARSYFWAAMLVVLFGDAVHGVLPLLIRHQGRAWRIDVRVVSARPVTEPTRGPARYPEHAEPPAPHRAAPDYVEDH